MEFDEIDYLEKTFDVSQEDLKPKETLNGGDDKIDPRGNGGSQTSKLKGEEKVDGDDDYHRSKHSRLEDNSHDNDRRGERDSSCHHSRSRDTERDRHRSRRESRDDERGRDRDRNREERNGRYGDRDRERDHDRGHDRERTDRDSDRHSERERIKQGEEERLYRSKSQSERHLRRSRSHSERHHSQSGSLSESHQSQSRSRSERHRSRSRSQSDRHQSDRGEKDIGKSWEGEQRGRFKDELRDRESRRQKDKKEEVAETEVDPERDQRTVFAYQINLKADERDVYDFFSRAGKVRDVRLIMDRNSRRSKGVGYVEFYDAMSVPMAIALSGQLLLGQAVMVKPSEAEKNLVQSTTASNAASGGPMGPYSGGARRLYVGNLHTNITEDQLRQVFEPFGTVELVQLPLNESGHCKGYGFVQFARLEDARNALNLNGQIEIADRPIKVSAVTDQTECQDAGTNPADIDDDEGGGLSLNAHARALLMQKLDRTGTASSMVSSLASPAVCNGVILPTVPTLGGAPVISPVVAPLLQGSFPTLQGGIGMASHLQASVSSFDTVGVQSECLLLKNMFDPKDEVEVDFELDIKEDVREECSKFGEVKHIFVDKNSAGFVYLRFGNVQSAIDAQKALHGRWFAGKMITATFMVPQAYEYKFPDSGL